MISGTIRIISEAFGLPFGWGLTKRLEYLQDTVGLISDKVQRLLQLRTECTPGAETILIDKQIDFWLKAFQRFQWKIKDLKWPNRAKPDHIDDVMITRAREYPIMDLLDEQPHRGKNIHCPFHGEDVHPSASIKNNHFKCFACGESHDSISFIMKTKGINFIEAVKQLT